jgi:hypothetical protein
VVAERPCTECGQHGYVVVVHRENQSATWSATGFRALCQGLLGEGFDLGSDGIAQQIACALLIPISFWTGWIDSVRFISLITVIGLALGSLSACSQPESRSKKMATCDTATRLRVSYVTNMGETRNAENPEPMTAAERMRRHRARQLGDDVPRVKPGPKLRKPQTLREASLEELIDEVSDRLTGRMADDREIRELAFRGVVHSYQTSSDRLSFVSIEPFAEE